MVKLSTVKRSLAKHSYITIYQSADESAEVERSKVLSCEVLRSREKCSVVISYQSPVE